MDATNAADQQTARVITCDRLGAAQARLRVPERWAPKVTNIDQMNHADAAPLVSMLSIGRAALLRSGRWS